MSERFDASKFSVAAAKPLPVVLLLDTSGSMHGDKIETLNGAVRRMIGTLTKEESQAHEFLVSVITFGGSASVAVVPTKASDLHFSDLRADGGTPLGGAMDIAKALIEDREHTPGRAYRPLVVLVSDGIPTDSWEGKMDHFIQDGRSSKCDRMALGIGAEAYSGPGRATLERFIAGTGHEIFEAKDAGEIHSFFKFVTMSVVSRNLSQNPNLVPDDPTPPPVSEYPPSSSDSNVTPSNDEEEDSYW